jgi:eukaryotic-like serine/threonine-protein kinase
MTRRDDSADPPARNGKSNGNSTQFSSRTHQSGRFGDVRGLLASRPDIREAEVVAWVCSDQVRRWRAGERVPAEAYLALHPALQSGGDTAFELIYGEFMLRESLGDSPKAEEFAWRFPHFAERLQRQLELHRALAVDLEDADDPPDTQPADHDVASPGLPIGPSIPGFRIVGELGRGGMGVVYKAIQLSLNRLVALKVIHSGAYAISQAAVRFRAEAEAVARFQHPNIIQVFEVGENEGVGYLSLEYAAGGSLEQKLARKPQEARQAAVLLEVLARAIHSAHQRGIVHRDLKPANVVVTEDGVPKITDFGLAKLLEQTGSPSIAGAIVGTPSYMAPELARGDPNEVTAAVDIYALGAILYEMLTGRPPFLGSTPLSTLEQVTGQEPLPPTQFQRHTPRDLETICLKCLQKDPHRRYRTAQALAEDLNRFLEGRPIVARPASPWELAWKWAKRKPSTAVGLLSFLWTVLLMLFGALYYSSLLRSAVRTAQAAEKAADRSAQTALDQRNLALKAFNQLVFEVQDKIGETPATRSLRRSLLDTAISGLDEIAQSTEKSAPSLGRAVAHQKLGEIFRQIGRAEDALRQLEHARRLAEGLAADASDDIPVAECLSRACLGLGGLYVGRGEPEKARHYFQRVVDLTAEMPPAPLTDPKMRTVQIQAHFQMGRALGFSRQFGESEQWLRKTQALAERWISAEPGNTQAQDMLAACFRKLGDVGKLTNNDVAARRDYLEAIQIGRKLVLAEPTSRELKRNLAMALDDLAGLAHHQRELSEARKLYEEAEQRFVELERADPEDADTQLRLFLVHSGMGKVESDDGRYSVAKHLLRQSLDTLQRLEHEGRLGGQLGSIPQRIDTIQREIADCEAAPLVLRDLATVASQPLRTACTQLVSRARLLAGRGDKEELLETIDSVCSLDPTAAEDVAPIIAAIAECQVLLNDDRWPGQADPRIESLRRRCAERVTSLKRMNHG